MVIGIGVLAVVALLVCLLAWVDHRDRRRRAGRPRGHGSIDAATREARRDARAIDSIRITPSDVSWTDFERRNHERH